MAYNRPAAVARLLHSLATATIAPDTPLIISLDNSPTQPEVRQLVEAFAWPHGPKHIQAWARHLGLVEHVILVVVMFDEFTQALRFSAQPGVAFQCRLRASLTR